MENTYGNFNYNLSFIENLQAEISKKVAEVVNKQNTSRKFDLNYRFDISEVSKLETYNDILEGIKKCNSCYEESKIEDVIQKVKKVINNL